MYMILLTSSLLILLIIGLRKLAWKKISPTLQYGLWLLVAIRLLLPFQIGSSSLSLENLFPQKTLVQEEVQIPTSDTHDLPIQSSITSPTPTEAMQELPITEQVMEELPLPSEERPVQEVVPVAPHPNETQVSDTMTGTPSGSVEQTQKSRLTLSANQILNLVWFIGFATMAAWFTAVNIRFQKTAMEDAVRIEVPQIPLPVYESNNILSPCMVGLLRPRILLSPGDTPSSRAHILTHEYTHYRHKDHIWSFIRGLCLCIHWFNPLVWVAAYLSKEDCEMACDHSTINTLGDSERIPYGYTLVETVKKAGHPDSLLCSATTMGGGMNQMRRRFNRITQKPKKLLWVAISLLLVLALAVGCTFTGGKDATQDPEEDPAETTVPTEETTVPTEETTDTLAEDETLLDDSILANLYEDSTYELFPHYPYATRLYKDENYEIPQVVVSKATYDDQINAEIEERFRAILEGGESPYKSVSYRWNVATLEGVDCFDLVLDGDGNGDLTRRVFMLDITAVDQQNNTEIFSYCIDISTEEALTGSTYTKDIQEAVTRELIRELYDEYANVGKISFTEEDLAVYEENLTTAVENATVKVLSHNSVTFTVPYVTMDGSVRDLDLNPMPTESISVNALYEPKVIDLYTYTADDGSVCTLPFVLLDNERGIQLNTEILWNYLHHLPPQASYTWAVHGDIISFSMKAQDPHTFGLMCMAENLYTDPTKDGTPDKEYVLSQAKTPMTYEEYKDKARILFPSYFFDLFPGITEQFPNDQMVLQQVIRCGSSVNIDLSTPYLDEKGNVWAMGKIYQIAGSESTINLIPISTGKVNEEYRAFAEANHFSMTAEETLLSYLECLYGAGNYDLIYTAEQAYPEYVDDKIHAESYVGQLLITIYRELTPTLTEQDLVDIPELKAATDLLGVKEIYSAFPRQITGDNVTAYSMIIANSNFTNLDDRYVELVWDVDLNAVHILIHPGL